MCVYVSTITRNTDFLINLPIVIRQCNNAMHLEVSHKHSYYSGFYIDPNQQFQYEGSANFLSKANTMAIP